MNRAGRAARWCVPALGLAWAAVVLVAYARGWGARVRPFVHAGPPVVLLGALLLAARAVGGALVRPLDLPKRGESGAASLRLALGFAVLSWAWLALGAAHALHSSVAWILLAALAAAGGIGLVRDLRVPVSPSMARVPPGALVPAALALVAMVLALPMALAPPASTDELVYHLTLPKWYVEAGGLFALPRFAHAAFPAQMDMLYAWALLLGEPVAAKLVHLALGTCAVALAATEAKKLSGLEAAAAAAAILLTTPVFLLNLSWAWADAATALYVLAGCVLVTRARESLATRHAVAAGLAWGMALGTKYTAGLYLALALPILMAPRLGAFRELGSATWWRVALGRRRVAVAAAIGIVAVVLVSPYLVRNALVHGNPVHPMGASLVAGGDDAGYRLLYTHRGDRSDLRSRARGALAYTLWNGRTDETLGPIWLLAAPVAFVLVPGARRLLLLGVAAAVVLGACFAGSVRYQIPSLVLMAVPIGAWLGAWLSTAGMRRMLAAALLLAAAASNLAVVAWHDRELFDPTRVALGFEAEDAYLARVEPGHSVLLWIDANVREDARILALGTQRLFHLDRPVVTAGPLDVSPARDWARDAATALAFEERLRTEGVTHVLFDRAGFERDVLRGLQRPAWSDDALGVLDEWLEHRAVRLARDGSVELYAVR